MNLADRPIAITDLETSGDVFGMHEILEIGLVLVDPKSYEILDTLGIKVRPEHIENAIPAALTRNGYSADQWQDAVPLADAVAQYAAKTHDAIFYAYNATFDWGFMNEAFRKTGIKDTMDYHRIDIMSLAYGARKDQITSLSLDAISKLFSLPPEPMPHSALNGALQAYYLLKAITSLEFYQFKGILEP